MPRLVAARATRYRNPVSTRPLSDARIRRLHAVLRSALGDAEIPVNPAAAVKFKVRPLIWTAPRVENWQRTGEIPSNVMVWTREQTTAFLASISGYRLCALYFLAAHYGLRESEVANLRWLDVDLAARRIHVRGDVKSGDSDRVIAIGQFMAEVLLTWKGQQMMERLDWADGWIDSGHVFTKENGQPVRPAWIYERFKTFTRKAKLPPARFHDLRHGSATMLIAAGVNIKVVSELMGHATSAFTADVYVSVAEELLDAAAAAIEAYLPNGASTVPAQEAGDA